jgi:hypothetical protein
MSMTARHDALAVMRSTQRADVLTRVGDCYCSKSPSASVFPNHYRVRLCPSVRVRL